MKSHLSLHYAHKAIALAVCAFLFAACNQTQASPTVTPEPSATATAMPTATFTPAPTSTPEPSPTPLPTNTPTPAATPTSTPAPAPTKAPQAAPTKPAATATSGAQSAPAPAADDWKLPEPKGKPVSTWRGVPIPPEAIAGQEDKDVYIFTTQLKPAQVQKYYEQNMAQFGWELFATGQGENLDYAPMLFFKKGDSAGGAVALIPRPSNGLTYVMLTFKAS